MERGTNNTIIFRCRGGRETGLGHLSRCGILARYLGRGTDHVFLVDSDPLAARFLSSLGLRREEIPPGTEPEDEARLISQTAAECGADFLVLDIKDTGAEYMSALRETGLLVVDIEDRGPGRAQADILVDTHIHPGEKEKLCSGPRVCGFGPEWALLHPLYARIHRRNRITGHLLRSRLPMRRVLVSCGGTDPSAVSGRIVRMLDRRPEDFEIVLVRGPGTEQYRPPENAVHPIRVVSSQGNLARWFYRSSLAVVSGGLTMLESICLGLPTIVAPQHEEQFRNAEKLASREALLLAPPAGDEAFGIGLEILLAELFHNERLRERLSRKGWSLVDGRGIERLERAICEVTSQYSASDRR